MLLNLTFNKIETMILKDFGVVLKSPAIQLRLFKILFKSHVIEHGIYVKSV